VKLEVLRKNPGNRFNRVFCVEGFSSGPRLSDKTKRTAVWNGLNFHLDGGKPQAGSARGGSGPVCPWLAADIPDPAFEVLEMQFATAAKLARGWPSRADAGGRQMPKLSYAAGPGPRFRPVPGITGKVRRDFGALIEPSGKNFVLGRNGEIEGYYRAYA